MKLTYYKLWVKPTSIKGKMIEMLTLHHVVEIGKQSALREANNLFQVRK